MKLKLEIVSIIILVCSTYFNSYAQTGTMIDTRDGKEYKTIKIGRLTWMAENLAYEAPNGNSDCYKDNDSICKKFGRLYRWNVAMEVCPSGWRLPTKNDIQDLLNAVGGDGVKLFKDLTIGGNSGFNFQIGGSYVYHSIGPTFRHPTGYRFVDDATAIWTSTEWEHTPRIYGIKIKKGWINPNANALVFGGRRKSTFYKEKKKSAFISDGVNKESAESVRCVK